MTYCFYHLRKIYCREECVDRVTKTTIIIKNVKFRKSDGGKVGKGIWDVYSPEIMPFDEKKIAESTRKYNLEKEKVKAIAFISDTNLRKMSCITLSKIVKLIKDDKKDENDN